MITITEVSETPCSLAAMDSVQLDGDCEASHSSYRVCFEKEFVESFVDGHDVFGVLPTVYAKSLCYACLPIFSQFKRPKLYCSYDNSCSIMNDQVCSMHVIIMKIVSKWHYDSAASPLRYSLISSGTNLVKWDLSVACIYR